MLNFNKGFSFPAHGIALCNLISGNEDSPMTDVDFERKFWIGQAEALIARIGLTDDIKPVLASLSSKMNTIASLSLPHHQRKAIIFELLTAVCREASERAMFLALRAEIMRDDR
jgi:hypothetical protein